MLIKAVCSTLSALNLRIFLHSKYRYSSTALLKNMGVPASEIVKTLLSFAPLSLAEDWDNVGLLVDSMSPVHVKKILLTNDLTEDVLDEAVKIKAEFIISYHPVIFQGLKSVCAGRTWKERIIVKCIKNDIAVFSPHTSWDCINGGVNDWLASAFSFKTIKPIKTSFEFHTQGIGRLLHLEAPLTVGNIVENVKNHVEVSHLRLALARQKSIDSLVSSVALCAGSGTSVLKGIEADLYLTGEMSHHDILDASQRGIHVILCEHSNSERGFLQLFRKQLKTKLSGDSIDVVISNSDKDPLIIV